MALLSRIFPLLVVALVGCMEAELEEPELRSDTPPVVCVTDEGTPLIAGGIERLPCKTCVCHESGEVFCTLRACL